MIGQLQGADPRVVDLVEQLHEVMDGMSRLSGALADKAHAHPTDVAALSALARHHEDRLTIGALGHELGMSKATTTSVVDRLERAGHVRRSRDERDRRRVYLEVTPSAHVLAEGVLSGFLERLRGALDHYSDEQLRSAQRFLRDIGAALGDSTPREAGAPGRPPAGGTR